MWAHFKHICLKNFPMVWGTFQSNKVWPLKSLSKDLGVHKDFDAPPNSSRDPKVGPIMK
jgi:hypothetical protein